MSIGDILREMASTADDHAELYGDSYIRFGAVMSALYPVGYKADSTSDFVRMGVIIQILNKLIRYTAKPGGHKDSAHDLAVYGAMLERVTE